MKEKVSYFSMSATNVEQLNQNFCLRLHQKLVRARKHPKYFWGACPQTPLNRNKKSCPPLFMTFLHLCYSIRSRGFYLKLIYRPCRLLIVTRLVNEADIVNKTRPLFTLSLEMTRLVNETRLLLVPGVNIRYTRTYIHAKCKCKSCCHLGGHAHLGRARMPVH